MFRVLAGVLRRLAPRRATVSDVRLRCFAAVLHMGFEQETRAAMFYEAVKGEGEEPGSRQAARAHSQEGRRMRESPTIDPRSKGGKRRGVALYDPRNPPRVWRVWLTGLGVSPRVSRHLWHALLQHNVHGEIGVVVRAERRQDRATIVDLLTVVSPRYMLMLCQKVSPEGQGERDPEVRQLETSILSRARHADTWR
jgi:hypothetical protein